MKKQKERNLYLVETKRCGTFYAVAETWNEAAKGVKETLDADDYGFSSEREVESVKLVRQERWLSNKPFLSGDYDINKIVIVDKEEPIFLTEKEKEDYVTPSKFLHCIKRFNDKIKVGDSYWLSYQGNDRYCGRSDNFLNETVTITTEELLTCFVPCKMNSKPATAKHVLFLLDHGVKPEQIKEIFESDYFVEDKKFVN
jgi:hypothetical protein